MTPINFRMRVRLPALAVLLAPPLATAPGQARQLRPRGKPVHVTPLPTDTSRGYLVSYYEAMYEHGPARAGSFVLRTPAAYVAVMAEVFGETQPRVEPPPVDFARETVVGYALGGSGTGGRVPAITAAARRADTLAVYVRIAGCPTRGDGPWAPAAFARVQRHDGPVMFVADSVPCRRRQ